MPDMGNLMNAPWWLVPAGLGAAIQLKTNFDMIPERIKRWEPHPDSPYEQATTWVLRHHNDQLIQPESHSSEQIRTQAEHLHAIDARWHTTMGQFLGIVGRTKQITRAESKTLWSLTNTINDDADGSRAAFDKGPALIQAMTLVPDIDAIPVNELGKRLAYALTKEFMQHIKGKMENENPYMPRSLPWTSEFTVLDYKDALMTPVEADDVHDMVVKLGGRERAAPNSDTTDADEFIAISDTIQLIMKGQMSGDNLIEIISMQERMLANWKGNFTWRDTPVEEEA
jgi:hypothetical protein